MGLANIIKNQKHKQMEHFAVLFVALMLAFIVVVVLCFTEQAKQDKEVSDSQAIYTTGFTTTISGVQGSVMAINSNEDNTQATVLMYFDDMSDLSSNPSMYDGWITAIDNAGNKYNIETEVSGDYYIFGNTGYVLAYLHSTEPLPAQKLYLRMQPERVLATSNSTSSDDNEGTADYYEVIFNPSGTDAKNISAFANGQFDSTKYFLEQIVENNEKVLREQCEEDLKTLATDMAVVLEQLERVKGDGVVTDGMLPADVSGDSLTVNDDGTYNLITTNPTPGSFTFDWKNGSIAQGYLKDLVGTTSTDTIAKFLESHVAAAENNKLSDLSKLTWKKADGSVVSADENTNIKNLISSIEKYRDDKAKYEVDDMLAFLELELDYMSILNKTVSAQGIIVKP